MLKRTEAILSKYTMGIQRLPLEDAGCHELNRGGEGVSGPHCHTLFREIRDNEGMVVWRYRRGICLAPNVKEPLAVANFTNAYVQKQPSLLAPVALKPLRGSIAKTHLWHSMCDASAWLRATCMAEL